MCVGWAGHPCVRGGPCTLHTNTTGMCMCIQCMRVHTCMHDMHIHGHTHTHLYTHTHTHARTHAHTHTLSHAHTAHTSHTSTLPHAHAHVCMRPFPTPHALSGFMALGCRFSASRLPLPLMLRGCPPTVAMEMMGYMPLLLLLLDTAGRTRQYKTCLVVSFGTNFSFSSL